MSDKEPGAGGILRESASIVEGVRQKQHGDKERSFSVIAKFWTTYLHNRNIPEDMPSDISAFDVAQMMVLLKIARSIQGSPMRDHFVDEAGYAAIAGEIAEAQNLGDFSAPPESPEASKARGFPVCPAEPGFYCSAPISCSIAGECVRLPPKAVEPSDNGATVKDVLATLNNYPLPDIAKEIEVHIKFQPCVACDAPRNCALRGYCIGARR